MAGDHACPECEATFTRPQHVTRHARIHTGERPYACKTCPEAFPRSDLLSRHITRNHGTQQFAKKRKRPLGAVEEDQGRRACSSCVKARARCDGEETEVCGRCKSKGIECPYPEASSNDYSAGPSSSISPPPPPQVVVASSSSPLPGTVTNSPDVAMSSDLTSVVEDESNPLPSFDLQGSPSSSFASWDSSSDASSANLSFSMEGVPPLPTLTLTTNEFLTTSYQEEQLPSMDSFGFGSPSPLLPTRTPSGIEPFVASTSFTYPLGSQPPPPFLSSSYAQQPSSSSGDFGYLPAVVDSSWGEMTGLEGFEENGTTSKERVDENSFGLVGMPSPSESGHTISTRASNEAFFSTSSISATSASLHRYSPPSSTLHYSHPISTTTLNLPPSSSSRRASPSKPFLQPSYLSSSPLPLTTHDLVKYQRKQKEQQERELETFFETCFHPPTSLVEPQTSTYLAPSPHSPQTLFERRKASPQCSSSNTTGVESTGGSFGDQVGLVAADDGSFPLYLGGGLVQRRSPSWWESGRSEPGLGVQMRLVYAEGQEGC